MHRPGVMAPPSLYDEQPAPGLMSLDGGLPPLDLSLNALFWSVATVLAAVELTVRLSL
jgi:hypothetical protein